MVSPELQPRIRPPWPTDIPYTPNQGKAMTLNRGRKRLFRLLSLMLFVTLCAFAFAWLAFRTQQARLRDQRAEEQAEIVAKLGRLSPHASYDDDTGYVSDLLLEAPPDGEIGDGLAHLKELPELTTLHLTRTKVADAALVHLKALPALRYLNLQGANVSDAGLVRVGKIATLTNLDLRGTKVTDAGIAHLKGLVNLRQLNLAETHVTDLGLPYLAALANLDLLDLCDTRITDAGLIYLQRLPNLAFLFLQDNTHVTQGAVRELRRKLPNVTITWSPRIDRSRRPRAPCGDLGTRPR